VLQPAAAFEILPCVIPQRPVEVAGHTYRVDYEIVGAERSFAIELDGFEFHGSRPAFTYDRLRQNDLLATGRTAIRFSYDAIRLETERCVQQLQAALKLDPLLTKFIVAHPVVERPGDGSRSIACTRASAKSNHVRFILRHRSKQAQSQDASRLPDAGVCRTRQGSASDAEAIC
jgi:hypothetical protein